MSLDASVWAWKQKCGKSSSKLVLLSLADRAGADHCAFPSIETLSRDTELNSKTIRTAIKHLIEIALIRDTNSRKGPTQQVKVYQLIGVIGRHETLPKTADFKDTQKGKGSEIGSLPKTDLKTTDFGLEDTQNWVAEPINNLSRNQKNNSNSAHEETHPVLAKAKQADQTGFRKYQSTDVFEPMTITWQPSSVTFSHIASLGIPPEFIEQQIKNFCVYWIAENRAPKSNTWDSAFLGNVQRNWFRFQNQTAQNKNQQPAKAGWSAGVQNEVVL
jgi:hypothetical protein